jgi:alkylation response protein AidB-like acyl-CoA dehydrogenase
MADMLDPPLFDALAFHIDTKQADLIARTQRLAVDKFASRAAQHDRDASFPTKNYHDLRLGADYLTYVLAAAEVARSCGKTALTWNMHVCSTLWTGSLADDLEMDATTRAEHERRRALHFRRIVVEDAIYAQPFSEGNASAVGAIPFGMVAKPVEGGWLVTGRKVFASLSGHADYCGVLCTERWGDESASRRNTLYLAIPAHADGVAVIGDWEIRRHSGRMVRPRREPGETTIKWLGDLDSNQGPGRRHLSATACRVPLVAVKVEP